MMDHEKILLGVRDWLKSFAEENRNSLTHHCYEEVWNTIQSIDHDLEEN